MEIPYILLLACSAIMNSEFCECQRRNQFSPNRRSTVPSPSTILSNSLSSSPAKLSSAINKLGFDLYPWLSKQDNVVYSPLSISFVLAMVYLGAKGTTLAEMSDVLGFNYAGLREEEVHREFQNMLRRHYETSQQNFVDFSNRVYIQNYFDVNDTYRHQLDEFYRASIHKVDFSQNGDGVKREINDWINEVTRGKISNLVPSPLPRDTLLLLLNAIYFKGLWQIPFDPRDTEQKYFRNNGNQPVAVPMMFTIGNFPNGFDEELGVHILELPYVGTDITMIILLPEGDISTLEKTVNPENFERATKKTALQQLRVSMPKFQLSIIYDLERILRSMGIRQLFSKNQADLEKISPKYRLHVSKVRHQSTIEVNEEGTVASAVSGVNVHPLSLPRMFEIDKPFMFFIKDKGNGNILFMGRINKL